MSHLYLLALFIVTPKAEGHHSVGAVLQHELSQKASAWLRSTRGPSLGQRAYLATGLEVTLGEKGAAQVLRLGHSSGDEAADDLARHFVLSVEPFTKAAHGTGRTCLVRVVFAKAGLKSAAACPDDNGVMEVFGLPLSEGESDAAARLLLGLSLQREGDTQAAIQHLRGAADTAATWPLAAKSVGLALLGEKKPLEALPYLTRYLESEKESEATQSLRRNLERFKSQLQQRIVDANKPRSRLGKKDILLALRKGYPLLEPCLHKARQQGVLKQGLDTLVMSWTVLKDGKTRSARLEAPDHLVMTAHSECLEDAATRWRFPPYSEGSEISINRLPIKVRGTMAPQNEATSGEPVAAMAAAPGEASSPEDDEPTFSTCERSPQEIAGHTGSKTARITACLEDEGRRSGAQAFPDQITVSFVIDALGPVRDAMITHRHYRDGPLQSCIAQALEGTLAPVDGADCPAEFSIDLTPFKKKR